jgi:hypothetical protein
LLIFFAGPGMIEKMSVKWLNASKFLVSWDPPPVHGGLINYYELSIRLVDEFLCPKSGYFLKELLSFTFLNLLESTE